MPLLKKEDRWRSVVNDESSLIVRDGAPWDESAEPKVQEFPDEQHAKAAYDRLLAAMAKEGWTVAEQPEAVEEMAEGAEEPEEAPATSAANPAMERAIEKDPDDERAMLVYGDWLQSRGDPRGALMSVQHALETAEGERREILLSREKELFGTHRNALLRQFAEYDRHRDWPMLKLRWRRGFVDGAELWIAKKEIEEWFLAFVDLPVCRFLRELSVPEITATRYDEDACIPWYSYAAVVDVLANQTRLATLERLELGSPDIGDTMRFNLANRELGRVDGLFRQLPRLRSLSLAAGSAELGEIDAPSLERFAFHTGALHRDHVASMRKARWPKLTALTVGIGDLPPARGGATLADLEWLLIAKELPRLTHLGIVNVRDGDALCEQILASRVLKQLESLDLSYGSVTDAGLEAFGGGKKKLAGLKRIELTDNPEVTDEGVEQLQADLPGCEIVRREIDDLHDWDLRWGWEPQSDEM